MTTEALSPAKAGVTARRTPSPKGSLLARVGSRLLSLNALLAFAFLYAPIVILVIFSFNASRLNAVWQGFTLEWYSILLRDEMIHSAFKNSMIVATASTVISTVLGTMTALVMERFRFRLRSAFDAVLYLPIIIPDIVMAVSLLLFFVSAFRVLSSLAGIQWQLGLGTIIIAHVSFNISFVAVVVRARLADFDRTLEEAAQDLGANEWQTFRRVTLPLIMPGIIGGALLAFTLSIDDFVITFFTAGVGSTTLPIRIYGMIKRTITPEINAISSLMLLASIGLVLLSLLVQRRK
ncbi:MAG: ABC transporter permease [Chloroflexi bacterium]|nr:MAG: ABC transporter permease [Chloroflexota bacterium]